MHKKLVIIIMVLSMVFANIHVFTPSANFSKISEGLYIDKILHKTFIDVNEGGTEAAAATVIMMEKGEPYVTSMKIDRPFLTVIEDGKTDSILFVGKVSDIDSGDE